MVTPTGNPNAKSQRGWSNAAEKGLDKYTSLKTSKAMRAYRKKFREAGKTGGDEKFYEFVSRSRLRKTKR